MDCGYKFRIIFPVNNSLLLGRKDLIKYVAVVNCTCVLVCFPLGTIDVKNLRLSIIYYLEFTGPYFVNVNSISVTML